MRIGFGAPVSGAWASPGDLTSFGAQAEKAGYASLWTFQRLFIPAGADGPGVPERPRPDGGPRFPGRRDIPIRLGVALINMPFISPGLLAKQATTVDVLSGGRLDLGLGIGWLPEEFRLTGASDGPARGPGREYVRVLHELWNPGADAESQYDGEFYAVPPGRQDPEPVQRPGPPVILGGMSRPAMN